MVNLEKVAQDTWSFCKKDKNTSTVFRICELQKNDVSTDDTPVSIENKDYVSIAYDAAGKNQKVAILNMCSDRQPGGGFLKGATAGEEELCRRSTLYPQLLHHRQEYPFHEPKLIYSKSVSIIKAAGTLKRLKEEREVDVISIPALRKPSLTSTGKYKRSEDFLAMRDRIDAIYKVAEAHGIECLILSAFGSGCFQNPAQQVAKMFQDRLQYYNLKEVVFGILDDCLRGRDTSNLITYKQVFDPTAPE